MITVLKNCKISVWWITESDRHIICAPALNIKEKKAHLMLIPFSLKAGIWAAGYCNLAPECILPATSHPVILTYFPQAITLKSWRSFLPHHCLCACTISTTSIFPLFFKQTNKIKRCQRLEIWCYMKCWETLDLYLLQSFWKSAEYATCQ